MVDELLGFAGGESLGNAANADLVVHRDRMQDPSVTVKETFMEQDVPKRMLVKITVS